MNRNLKSLLYAGLVSCVLGLAAAPSFAQVTSNSNATSASGSQSGAASNARANSGASTNQQNINFNSPAESRSTNNTTLNSNATSRSQEGVNYSGGTTNSNYSYGDQTIRNAPTVYAPPVSGGNPCSLGVSAGASFLGWGAAAGGSYVDEDCATRQKIAMVHNAGYTAEAREMMCNDRAFYFAARSVAKPCAYRPSFEGNVPAPQPAPQPMVQQQPTPIQQPVIAPVSSVVPSAQTLRRCRGANDQGPCYSG